MQPYEKNKNKKSNNNNNNKIKIKRDHDKQNERNNGKAPWIAQEGDTPKEGYRPCVG